MRIEIDVPEGTADADDLKRRESLRACELAAQGTLLRLWRIPGRWANWGLWSARDEPELLAALDSLPLRPFIRLFVQPLEGHPNDPGLAS